VGAIIDLRHRILRADMPPEAARCPGDIETSTWHVGLYYPWPPNENAPVVSCASFMAELYNGEPAWRLRGMCTETNFQGWGFGGKLLAGAEAAIIRESNVRLFWCHARLPALRFYERHGWKVDSEVLNIPTAGPRRRMVKRAT
jgi:GNAT superfamily N-acetyltransferase